MESPTSRVVPGDPSGGTSEPATRGAETVDALSAATQAADDLRDALAAVGITLPSLGADLVSCTSAWCPRPLVELGRCNLLTARALTAALRKAGGR
ncbi:hypothetical protein [Streptomyces zingiberis]|uniref:Uncharacterized protein n=1 Tax=Streptomyces zingiberis TaxID=2053010 RepID=A0ABX1C5Z7_9ACTN|nr:hypothetical protein [Streptomyces zingiberis]NJQ03610.1 hypothetical protein [Streptomyces zingiberis]